MVFIIPTEWAPHAAIRAQLYSRIIPAELEVGLRSDSAITPVRLGLAAALAAAGPDAEPRLRAVALHGAGRLALVQGDYRRRSWPASRRARRSGDRLATWPRRQCLGEIGAVQHVRGDYGAARACYTESLALGSRSADDAVTARSLSGLGRLALFQNDLVQATAYYQESMARVPGGRRPAAGHDHPGQPRGGRVSPGPSRPRDYALSRALGQCEAAWRPQADRRRTGQPGRHPLQRRRTARIRHRAASGAGDRRAMSEAEAIEFASGPEPRQPPARPR